MIFQNVKQEIFFNYYYLPPSFSAAEIMHNWLSSAAHAVALSRYLSRERLNELILAHTSNAVQYECTSNEFPLIRVMGLLNSAENEEIRNQRKLTLTCIN